MSNRTKAKLKNLELRRLQYEQGPQQGRKKPGSRKK